MSSIPKSCRVIGVLATLSLAAGGCGGSDSGDSGAESSTKTRQTSTAGGKSSAGKPTVGRCPVMASPAGSTAPRARGMGAPFEVQLSAKSRAQRAEVTVTGVRTPKRIVRSYQGKGAFVPKAGRFVAVVFRFRNVGRGEIEAASTIGNLFGLTGRPPKTVYSRADGSKECNVISASFASTIRATSPEADVEPGKAYKTVVVYVVPTDEVEVDWFARHSGDLVPLPSSPPAE